MDGPFFSGRREFTLLPNRALLPNYISLCIINIRRHDTNGNLAFESEERSICIIYENISYYVSSNYDFQSLIVTNFSSSFRLKFKNSILIRNNLFA